MMKKRVVSIIAAVSISAGLLSGCGSGAAEQSPASSVEVTENSAGEASSSEEAETSSEDGSRVVLGMLTPLNMTTEEFESEEYTEKVSEKFEGAEEDRLNTDYVYYDNLNTMVLGLNAGDVDHIAVDKVTADYLVRKDPSLEMVEPNAEYKMETSLGALEDNSELIDEINGALNDMIDDNTLVDLRNYYVNPRIIDEEPDAVELPRIDGAETIKVAVTGDFPPLDLVRSDGIPAGFNTAVLAEIGDRIGKNIELVQVDAGGRILALTSGAVDVVFWLSRSATGKPDGASSFDITDGVVLSVPYFESEMVSVKVKDK